MSKVVLLCFRNRADNTVAVDDINTLSRRLMPDNISANPPIVTERDGLLVCALNPISSLTVKNTSICTGHMIEPSVGWWVPISPVPDGNFALFRSDDKTVELATDVVASRTIWYVQTESMFIASTSQRAIVFFLESFEPNNAAFVWMLSSGNLGLGNSWDRRIKPLPADTRLRLDRLSWKVTCEKEKTAFHPTGRTEQQYERELREALDYSFTGFARDYSKWPLLLSGGIDSRAILLMLKEKKNVQCVTWGLRKAINDKCSDAYIARQLANHFGLPHRYFELDSPKESCEKLFSRFISTGECRDDSISNYADGFRLWKLLFESNIQGVLRGDEVFGALAAVGNTQARQRQGVWMLQDYSNMQTVSELLKRQFGEQLLPECVKQEDGESLASFNDRLYQEFQVPVEFAAWNESKYSYVEVVNPLISRRIINIVRSMPDSMRANKALFKKIVTSDGPKIPYAKHRAIPYPEDIHKSPEAVDLMCDAINSPYFRDLFSNDLVDRIISNFRLETSGTKVQRSSLVHKVKLLLPERLKGFLKKYYKPRMSYSQLAFRTYLAGKAGEMFSADASWLAREKRRSVSPIDEGGAAQFGMTRVP